MAQGVCSLRLLAVRSHIELERTSGGIAEHCHPGRTWLKGLGSMKIATRGGCPLRPLWTGASSAGAGAASDSGGVTAGDAGTPDCSEAPRATALHLRAHVVQAKDTDMLGHAVGRAVRKAAWRAAVYAALQCPVPVIGACDCMICGYLSSCACRKRGLIGSSRATDGGDRGRAFERLGSGWCCSGRGAMGVRCGLVLAASSIAVALARLSAAEAVRQRAANLCYAVMKLCRCLFEPAWK